MSKDWDGRDLEIPVIFEMHEHICSNTTDVLERITIAHSVIHQFDAGDKFDTIRIFLSSYLSNDVVDKADFYR
ncbi:hypothetical protein [Streptococcus saliviloxodontae]|uniref:Uncharacterized protein n=1 Tax=Streptococcus saliviloxodontae TaxID=1349416 RepID=A0ABS2PJR9_9STRE|nr:hypothetical protein [Streptococcus saliviloxodontae]MBM7635341.1 hypothetical protein [Streptococcus saliviloxodontae]